MYQVSKSSPISFPGLFGDWEFTAKSYITIFNRQIYWYGILICIGVLIAMYYCVSQCKKYGISEDHFYDGVIFGIPAGILGARIYYVLFYLDMFRDSDGVFQWSEAIAIWDGGLAIYGTVIAVFLTCLILSKVKHFKLFALTDLIVQGLLIGQAVGRWGNFMNREAFGGETTLPWRMRLTNVLGQFIEVHPTFFYESLWNVLGLLLIIFFVSKERRFDGEITCFYFLWYGLGRFWIEGLRTDSLYLFNWTFLGEPIRVSQALSVVLIFVAVIALYINIKVHPHDEDELFVNQVKRNQIIQQDNEAQQI